MFSSPLHFSTPRGWVKQSLPFLSNPRFPCFDILRPSLLLCSFPPSLLTSFLLPRRNDGIKRYRYGIMSNTTNGHERTISFSPNCHPSGLKRFFESRILSKKLLKVKSGLSTECELLAFPWADYFRDSSVPSTNRLIS